MSSPRTRSVAIGGAVIALGALLWWGTRPSTPPAGHAEHQRNTPGEHNPGSDAVHAQPTPNGANDNDAGALAIETGDAGRTRVEQGTVIARAAWGSGPDQLAHSRPQEANPEAPMSHVVGPDGTIHVLDQVNRRIQRFSRDGRHLGSTPIPLLGAQDLAITRDGSYVVLDRLADRTVAIVGQDGRERARLPIVGQGIERTGYVTGMFVDGNDVLLEREHGPLVRVGDSNGGDTQNREEIPGRPTRDGRAWITAGITDQTEGRLYINAVARPTRDHMYTRELRVPMETRALVMLDSDARGVIYLGALGAARSAAGTAPIAQSDGGSEGSERILLMCLDGATGRPLGQTTLPPNTSADETYRDFTVPDEGGVIYQVRNDQGVEYRRYDCR